MTVTREAIIQHLVDDECADDKLDAERTYNHLTCHLGYDLADVINLGLAVLAEPRTDVDSTDSKPDLWALGYNDALDSISARAGVGRPAS